MVTCSNFILCYGNLGIVFCLKFLIAFMGDILEKTIGKLLLRMSRTWSEMGKQNFIGETVCFLMFRNFNRLVSNCAGTKEQSRGSGE